MNKRAFTSSQWPEPIGEALRSIDLRRNDNVEQSEKISISDKTMKGKVSMYGQLTLFWKIPD